MSAKGVTTSKGIYPNGSEYLLVRVDGHPIEHMTMTDHGFIGSGCRRVITNERDAIADALVRKLRERRRETAWLEKALDDYRSKP